MDQLTGTLIAGAVPTLAIIATFVQNEAALAGVNTQIARLNARIETLTCDMNARFETLTRRIESFESGLGLRCSTILKLPT